MNRLLIEDAAARHRLLNNAPKDVARKMVHKWWAHILRKLPTTARLEAYTIANERPAALEGHMRAYGLVDSQGNRT